MRQPRPNRQQRRQDQAWQGRRAPQAGPAAPGPGRRAIPWRLVAIAALAVLVIGIGVYAVREATSDSSEVDANLNDSPSLPGQYFPDQGRGHLRPGESYDRYNSNPPTSGPHDPVPAPWGVNTSPVAKEKLVHNFEHGGVAILHNCPSGCPDVTGPLAEYVTKQRGRYVLMAPYPGMEKRIALASWTRLDAFDGLDMKRVERFVDVHLCRFDPEDVCR